MYEKIEILPVELLDQNRQQVKDLKETAGALKLEFGWHYLLDLTWILSRLQLHLGDIRDKKIMDAGAGTGILQWHLAEQGAQIISVDRLNRAALSYRFRARYHVTGMRPNDLLNPTQTLLANLKGQHEGPLYRRWLIKTKNLARELIDILYGIAQAKAPGSIQIYNQDMADLQDIPDESLDAIVAVSSLEHNTQEGLEQVVDELMRVLKPGGILLATLVSAREQDWWHEASSAWCYTDESLRRFFKLPPDTPSKNHNPQSSSK